MSEIDETDAPTPQGGGDQYAKTLALLRRLLVGNGYKLEQIQIQQIENSDYKIPGKLQLELEIKQEMRRLAGPARGGEMRVFRDRTEEQSYLNSLRDQIAEQGWVEEVRALASSAPHGGWGLEEGRWSLPKLSQRVALQLICDLCLGTGNEKCLNCHGQRDIQCPTCSGSGTLTCQGCAGSGIDPADRSRPCLRCQGRRVLPCHSCNGQQRVPCHVCRGMGLTQCRECQGLKFQTEETTVLVNAIGRFAAGDPGKAPVAVGNLVDDVGAQGLTEGHALITPDTRANASGEAALFYQAIVPYGRFRMELNGKIEDIEAVGMRPVLMGFPKLIDDQINPVLEQINSLSLPSLSRKFRIIRELTEALARGVKPARFFTQRYPYGLSRECAFALVDRIRLVFKNISFIPRLLTGLVGMGAGAGAYYMWISQPRPASLPPQIPVMGWDLALAALLLLCLWLAIGIAGKQALQRLIPAPVSLRAGGGTLATGFAAALLAVLIALLLWPVTRPEWVSQLLR